MALTTYDNQALVLPFSDGTAPRGAPLLLSKSLDWAERFRKLGERLCSNEAVFPVLCDSDRWGLGGAPASLKTRTQDSVNWVVWYRDAEPLDLTTELTLPSSWIPHPFWKWRILVEPYGVTGRLYEVENPASPGSGASCMAEDFLTKEGVLTNLPNPFSAPLQHFNRVGNLQLAVTRDGGSTIIWTNPVWN